MARLGQQHCPCITSMLHGSYVTVNHMTTGATMPAPGAACPRVMCLHQHPPAPACLPVVTTHKTFLVLLGWSGAALPVKPVGGPEVGRGCAGARRGLLLRGGGAVLEKLANVKSVVLDKTGTLTEGG
eukprot:scaffold72776_cov19-Tisochrysis_lutea.AAC.3